MTTINDILIKKLETAGIDKLISIYGEQFNNRFTNMKSSKIPLEKRRTLIITKIMEAVTKNEIHNKIIDIYFAEKQKEEKPKDEWMSNFVIGEEVLIAGKYTWNPNRKGIIAKINKKSVSIELFAYEESDFIPSFENRDYGYKKLIWGTHTDYKQVIYDKNLIIKKGEHLDEEFIEGKRPVDYGK